MKKLLYILSLLVLAAACATDPWEVEGPKRPTINNTPKVEVDFSVQINDPSVKTRALAEKPTLRNLMVAVFDESGYLLEYTYATEITLATENTTRYDYKVAITQSSAPRIIHFIGNAPDKLTFGVEETVLAAVSSKIGDNPDDGIYWCRREIPQISGTQSGGAMALADEDDNMAVNTPIYQADIQTRAYFDNVGLIRNFSQLQLSSSSADFTLEKYYVVGTPKAGLASAYNYGKGEFVNYFTSSTITGNETDGYTFDLGAPKTFAEIIAEGYDANVLPSAEKFTLEDSATEANWIANGASAYVFECEKPLTAENAVYIIAYGKYKDGNNYYYKIDLRNANGYFPILRNFKYIIDIANVTRPGYESVEKAAASAGSGDISTSLETKSLAYISDGVASLEVEYIEKFIVNEGAVTLDYTFLDNVTTESEGDPSKMWIVVNEPGATGAAIATINGNSYTVGEKIAVAQNPGTITITPTALTNEAKSQTLTIYAEYTNGDASHILQRTVNYIVQTKRTMLVSLSPSEVPNVAGSEFDVNISLPAGLSKSIFPLELLIESGSLSINPHNDQMPVRSGVSLVDSGKSSFYFVKSFAYSDYNPESGAVNTVNCHFKTIKAEAATHIYAANPYFVTEYDYEGTISNEDADGKSVYLDTYTPNTFSYLSFSSDPVGVGEDVDVSFTFNMSKIPDDRIVYVSLGNLQPAPSETQLEYSHLEGGKVVYIFRPTTTSGTFQLRTAHFDDELSVDLSAYRFLPATKSAARSLFNFSGSFNKQSLTGTADVATYTFFVPYYYEGMVIEVEMHGLKFNDQNLPADWDNWRDLGNDVYAVQYKPSGFLNSVSINVVTTIESADEPCSITLSSKGYNTQNSTIEVLQTLTIPAGNLVMNATSWWGWYSFEFGNNGTISIFKASDDTPLGSYSYTRSSNNHTATNTNAVTLNSVTRNTEIYVTYKSGNTTYKSNNFTIEDAMDNNGVTQTLTN